MLSGLFQSKKHMHGLKGDHKWRAPRMTVKCDVDARPGYQTRKAHEYLDHEDVLSAKVRLLVALLNQSKQCIFYTGAGISTAAGVGDYATKATNSAVASGVVLKSPLEAEPTIAHRAITALHAAGHVKQWIQQNHDGLPQKAGFPQRDMNEIHGAWFDPSNPVVKMSGNLRSDLFQGLTEWEKKTDLCVTLGSSLCGMNADRVVETVSRKAAQGRDGALGAVIVTLQETQYDDVCALRIFAKIDDVMAMVAKEMGLEIPAAPSFAEESAPNDVFEVPYDEQGQLLANGTKRVLDLRDDKRIRVTAGPFEGCEGVVNGRNRQGHYRLCVTVNVAGKFSAPTPMLLGRWWAEEAAMGQLPSIPVVSVKGAAD